MSEIRDSGMLIVQKALNEGAGCGDPDHVSFKGLDILGEGDGVIVCPTNDAYNIIDALIAAGWKPPEPTWGMHWFRNPLDPEANCMDCGNRYKYGPHHAPRRNPGDPTS